MEGKLAYAEGFQSWNVIRLKKELFAEFPELKEKRSACLYRLAFFRSFKDLTNVVQKLKNEEVMPMMSG